MSDLEPVGREESIGQPVLSSHMVPADLAAWQRRLGLSDAEAARRLGVPYLTYREYLPGGRRRRDQLPGWLPILCSYVERFGPLDPDHRGGAHT